MPQQTKIFRVFVSSTFTDMREERRILQREVFPKLEKFCEERGAKFQAVDLRWGVNEESQLNQKTLDICLNEISRCQRVSPRPNFLVLLGDKYGWQPIPNKIEASEFDQVTAALAETEKEFLLGWYKKDENAEPAEFVLQPRQGAFKEYSVWKPVEDTIRTLLRKGAGTYALTNEKKIKYHASATHREILSGALHTSMEKDDPNEHVFVYSRTIAGLPGDESGKDYRDLTDNAHDAWCKEQLDALRESLKERMKGNYKEFKAVWKDGRIAFTDGGLEKFANDVFEFLSGVIGKKMAETTDPDEVSHEINLHKDFMERATEHFEGRKDILGRIDDYLKSTIENKVLSLIGDSGSGKSSVMAQAVKTDTVTGAVLVYRFIGTSSRSSNIMSLLQGLCSQVARAFDVDPLKFAREGNDKAWYEMYSLGEIFKQCLALATPEKPVHVFLDSLDQLAATDNAKALYWLPREMPPNARMVVSSLPELRDALHGTESEDLPLLPEAEARMIIGRWFGSVKRRLTGDQQQLILGHFNKVKLPIYLRLAFEKAKKWHSYDGPHTLKEDVPGIINDYFDDLEQEHTREFVTNATCYMLSGKYMGLAENEILEVLAFDPDYWQQFLDKTHPDHQQELKELKSALENRTPRGYMKIPISVWSRFYHDIEPYLSERDADGVPILTFFHRQFNEVLQARYELT